MQSAVQSIAVVCVSLALAATLAIVLAFMRWPKVAANWAHLDYDALLWRWAWKKALLFVREYLKTELVFIASSVAIGALRERGGVLDRIVAGVESGLAGVALGFIFLLLYYLGRAPSALHQEQEARLSSQTASDEGKRQVLIGELTAEREKLAALLNAKPEIKLHDVEVYSTVCLDIENIGPTATFEVTLTNAKGFREWPESRCGPDGIYRQIRLAKLRKERKEEFDLRNE